MRDKIARMEKEQPFYARHIFCCTNERPPGHKRGCCKEKGAEDLRNYMKSRAKEAGLKDVRVNTAGCLDRCELGPTMVVYPEGVWYTCGTKADVDEIVESHLKNGVPVERLRLKNDQEALTAEQKAGRG
jgi:(2Fe-2S) ferredoxin